MFLNSKRTSNILSNQSVTYHTTHLFNVFIDLNTVNIFIYCRAHRTVKRNRKVFYFLRYTSANFELKIIVNVMY